MWFRRYERRLFKLQNRTTADVNEPIANDARRHRISVPSSSCVMVCTLPSWILLVFLLPARTFSAGTTQDPPFVSFSSSWWDLLTRRMQSRTQVRAEIQVKRRLRTSARKKRESITYLHTMANAESLWKIYGLSEFYRDARGHIVASRTCDKSVNQTDRVMADLRIIKYSAVTVRTRYILESVIIRLDCIIADVRRIITDKWLNLKQTI